MERPLLRTVGILTAAAILTGCGAGQTVAERCRAQALADSTRWANGFIASLPDPKAVSPARRASLIATGERTGILVCEKGHNLR